MQARFEKLPVSLNEHIREYSRGYGQRKRGQLFRREKMDWLALLRSLPWEERERVGRATGARQAGTWLRANGRRARLRILVIWPQGARDLDQDNLYGGLKPLVDALRLEHLIVQDSVAWLDYRATQDPEEFMAYGGEMASGEWKPGTYIRLVALDEGPKLGWRERARRQGRVHAAASGSR